MVSYTVSDIEFMGYLKQFCNGMMVRLFNPLTPELNSSAQRCMTRFFTGDFAS
jgi:hypothetical protein